MSTTPLNKGSSMDGKHKKPEKVLYPVKIVASKRRWLKGSVQIKARHSSHASLIRLHSVLESLAMFDPLRSQCVEHMEIFLSPHRSSAGGVTRTLRFSRRYSPYPGSVSESRRHSRTTTPTSSPEPDPVRTPPTTGPTPSTTTQSTTPTNDSVDPQSQTGDQSQREGGVHWEPVSTWFCPLHRVQFLIYWTDFGLSLIREGGIPRRARPLDRYHCKTSWRSRTPGLWRL